MTLRSKISSMLPDSPDAQADYAPFLDESSEREAVIQEQAAKETARRSAAELAQLKLAAKSKVARAQKEIEAQQRASASVHSSLSTTPPPTPAPSAAKLKEAQDALETIEILEAQARQAPQAVTRVDVAAQNAMASGQAVKPLDLQNAIKLQGTSRKEITALMASLGINVSVQLTKADTQNIIACLLTCNETQLNALMANTKVPIAAKVVIKRLLDDAKVGNIETIERLWDRIFGKQGLVQALPETQTQQMQGLIPNVPVSREAYILIRDTLIQ